MIASWNRPEYFEGLIARHKGELAAVLCEPQMCNSGILPVDPEWLRFLRRITSENGILLIFDEVMTGFRLALGGAQGYYDVLPDIVVLLEGDRRRLPRRGVRWHARGDAARGLERGHARGHLHRHAGESGSQ